MQPNHPQRVDIPSLSLPGPGGEHQRSAVARGSRLAAPPEDCGGIWGYAELVEVLRDPADDEHNDRLEWLGLEAAEFDPDRFDAQAVTRALCFAR